LKEQLGNIKLENKTLSQENAEHRKNIKEKIEIIEQLRK
jgi:hypothetical protein